VNGYHLQASDGIIGHVCDFMMDTQSWAIRQLVIKTGHRFSGKEVQIPTSKVDRISYRGIHGVREFDQEAVEQSPAHHLAPVGAAIDLAQAHSPFMKHNKILPGTKTKNWLAHRGQLRLRT
jgi:hypothetical protein